jgi:hypothetical protein
MRREHEELNPLPLKNPKIFYVNLEEYTFFVNLEKWHVK